MDCTDCCDCDRFRLDFQRIVRRNLDVLSEYQSAVMHHDVERIETARAELHEIEALRREARLKLISHQGSHDATVERVMAAGQ